MAQLLSELAASACSAYGGWGRMADLKKMLGIHHPYISGGAAYFGVSNIESATATAGGPFGDGDLLRSVQHVAQHLLA